MVCEVVLLEYKAFPVMLACSGSLKVKWSLGDVVLTRQDDVDLPLNLAGWSFEDRGDFCILHFTVSEECRTAASVWVEDLGVIGHQTDVQFRFRDLCHRLFRPIVIATAMGYRMCFLKSPAELVTSGDATKLFV